MASNRVTVLINGRPTSVTATYARLFLSDSDVEVPADPDRPADGALKEEWLAHALSVDPEADDIYDLTKPQLIERYG